MAPDWIRDSPERFNLAKRELPPFFSEPLEASFDSKVTDFGADFF